MRSDDIPLNDIKPLAEIQDYTVWFFGALSILLTVLLVLAAYVLLRHWRQRRREDRRRQCLESLRHVAFDDPKAAAYAITRYGRCFAEDSPRLKEAYRNLTARLDPYKYRRTVPPLDEETLSYYRIFLGMIDA